MSASRSAGGFGRLDKTLDMKPLQQLLRIVRRSSEISSTARTDETLSTTLITAAGGGDGTKEVKATRIPERRPEERYWAAAHTCTQSAAPPRPVLDERQE